MRYRPRRFGAIALVALAPCLIGASAATGDVSVTVTGLRSDQGKVLACLTANPRAFPECQRDDDAHVLIAPAGNRVELDFGRVPEGRYAIALIHDENGNGKMDKRLILPREGFGFSRNAPLRLGPPSFEAASFAVDEAGEHQAIVMRYLF